MGILSPIDIPGGWDLIFQLRFLEGIVKGDITLAFRRWIRPSVRAGGTLRTAMGVVRIGAVQPIAAAEVTDSAARAAGYESAGQLLTELEARSEGDLYRIEVGYGGPDPRIALREETDLTPEAWGKLREKLRRLDAASASGPWTTAVLRLIAAHPGVRAVNLARQLGQERDPFKINVRKLKNLGLTESLEIGYRLSPRGQRLLESMG